MKEPSRGLFPDLIALAACRLDGRSPELLSAARAFSRALCFDILYWWTLALITTRRRINMTMATPRGVVAANLYNMLPRGLQSSNFAATYAARTAAVSWSSFLPSASITIPAITLNIPGIISEIWEGILRAVPKKKTSHMKKRHRQLAGKALKDVTSLVRCPACGKPKKAHTLCPYCVAGEFFFREPGCIALLTSASQKSRHLGEERSPDHVKYLEHLRSRQGM